VDSSRAAASSARLQDLEPPPLAAGSVTGEAPPTSAGGGGGVGGSEVGAEAPPAQHVPARFAEGSADAGGRRPVRSYPVGGLAFEPGFEEASGQLPGGTLMRGSSGPGLGTLSQTSQDWLRSLSQPDAQQVRRSCLALLVVLREGIKTSASGVVAHGSKNREHLLHAEHTGLPLAWPTQPRPSLSTREAHFTMPAEDGARQCGVALCRLSQQHGLPWLLAGYFRVTVRTDCDRLSGTSP
jgi:hypothetical protein